MPEQKWFDFQGGKEAVSDEEEDLLSRIMWAINSIAGILLVGGNIP